MNSEFLAALELLEAESKAFTRFHTKKQIRDATIRVQEGRVYDKQIPIDYDCHNPSDNPFHVRKEV